MQRIRIICVSMVVLILFCSCSNNDAVDSEPARAQDSSTVAEEALPSVINTPEPPTEVASQESGLSKPDPPPESEDKPVEERIPTVFAIEGEDYLYDTETGRLSFPYLAFSCLVPPEAMELLAIEMTSQERGSGKDGLGPTIRIDNVNFYYRHNDDSYIIFLLYRWPTVDWDTPKHFGPLPAEIARSNDNEWVILHGGSSLVAGFDIPSDLQPSIWTDFIRVYEDDIVASVAFDN